MQNDDDLWRLMMRFDVDWTLNERRRRRGWMALVMMNSLETNCEDWLTKNGDDFFVILVGDWIWWFFFVLMMMLDCCVIGLWSMKFDEWCWWRWLANDYEWLMMNVDVRECWMRFLNDDDWSMMMMIDWQWAFNLTIIIIPLSSRITTHNMIMQHNHRLFSLSSFMNRHHSSVINIQHHQNHSLIVATIHHYQN